MNYFYNTYETAIGPMTLIADEKSLVGVRLKALDIVGAERYESPLLYDAICQLNQYCFGQRKEFDVPMDITLSTTDFQKKVLSYVKTIPFGQTKTYIEVAKAIGCNSAQAVGQALKANPLPIFIPCHRVVGSALDIGGYIGNDPNNIKLKKNLIAFEKKNANRTFVAPTDYKDPEE